MSDPIFVIQGIADGAQGHPYDEILSLAVCKVLPDEGEFETVFAETVQVEPRFVGKPKLDYAESKGLNVPDLYTGMPLPEMVSRFHEIVDGQYITSYDIRQMFTRYLCNDPWDVTGTSHIMPSISTRQPISLKCKYPEDEPDIIVKAYRRTFRNDPIGAGKRRGALELAQMASMLLISLRERGKYRF